jgi:hypothetical protein
MSQIMDQLANAAAAVDRISATTGSYASIATGIVCILIPGTMKPAGPGGIPYQGESYGGEITDTLITEDTTQIKAGDRITVTPTGGSARTYQAHRPDVYENVIGHQSIPLADYTPGG